MSDVIGKESDEKPVPMKLPGNFINMIDWWSWTPYEKCSFRCVFCSVEAQGKSVPLFGKEDVPGLLDGLKQYRGKQMLALGISSDAYPPEEAEFGVTRAIIDEFRKRDTVFTISTHGALVVRDIDLLQQCRNLKTIGISIPFHDENLVRKYEPGAPTAAERIAAVNTLYEAGLPIHVNVSPWVPGLCEPDEIARRVPAEVYVNVTALSYNELMLQYKKTYLTDRDKSSAERVFGREFPDQQAINDSFMAAYHRIRGGTLGNLVWLKPPGINKSVIDRLPP